MMKKVGFIGGYEKTDFILYMSKILAEMGNTVLFIDGTVNQKSRYTIPSIKPGRAYITQFEGIDVAVGFENYDLIKQYLGIPLSSPINYDYILIDVDTPNLARNFAITECDKNYFVTSMDMYAIKRGTMTLNILQEPINMTKVLFSRQASKKENEYINFLTKESKIIWNEQETVNMPFELGDQSVIYENQRVEKIKFKGLTNQYKEGLIYITVQLMGEENYQNIRKIIKKIERGV